MTPQDQEYRIIELSQGQSTKISPHRYDELVQFGWFALYDKISQRFYAARNSLVSEGKPRTIRLHRQILGLEWMDPMHGDHINGDTLDNRDSNLRVATILQNIWNQKRRTTNTSGRKGISLHTQMQQWWPRITVNRVTHSLGLYDDFEEACRVREAAEKHYFGEFARPE